MDYIYGKLNETVKEVRYSGISTSTVDVEVDNTKNTITAKLKNLPTEDGEYILKANVTNGEVILHWELQE